MVAARRPACRPEAPEASATALAYGYGDTVIGSDKHACVLMLVERRSGFAVIKKLTARTADQAT